MIVLKELIAIYKKKVIDGKVYYVYKEMSFVDHFGKIVTGTFSDEYVDNFNHVVFDERFVSGVYDAGRTDLKKRIFMSDIVISRVDFDAINTYYDCNHTLQTDMNKIVRKSNFPIDRLTLYTLIMALISKRYTGVVLEPSTTKNSSYNANRLYYKTDIKSVKRLNMLFSSKKVMFPREIESIVSKYDTKRLPKNRDILPREVVEDKSILEKSNVVDKMDTDYKEEKVSFDYKINDDMTSNEFFKRNEYTEKEYRRLLIGTSTSPLLILEKEFKEYGLKLRFSEDFVVGCLQLIFNYADGVEYVNQVCDMAREMYLDSVVPSHEKIILDETLINKFLENKKIHK